MPRLAIVVALREELAALRVAFPDAGKQGVILVRGGVGWNSATLAVQALLRAPDPPKWICSSGFCGGLAETLSVGDILLPDSIQGPAAGETLSLPPPGLAVLRGALKNAFVGSLVTVRSAVFSCEEKRSLGQARNALAVDMESYAIASAAVGSGASVFALRAVSDSASDALPPEVGTFLTEDGRVRGTAVLRFVAKGPRNMKVLWALKSRGDRARASLASAWKIAWPEMNKLM